MNTKDKIRRILSENLSISHLEIIDDSHLHAGHGAKGGHFTLKISAKEFEGKTYIQRHRIVYQLLKNLMKNEIHALSIEAN